MAQTANEITIQRPISEVFGYIADDTNDPKWRAVLESTLILASSDEATIYHQIIAGPPFNPRVRFDYRVATYEPPYRQSFEYVRGFARPAGHIELTAVSPAATKVTYAMEWHPKVWQRMMGSMIEDWMREDVAGLTKLKENLEA